MARKGNPRHKHGKRRDSPRRRGGAKDQPRRRGFTIEWEPDRQQVLRALARHDKPVGLGQLAETLGLNQKDSVHALGRELQELKFAGEVMEVRPGRFLVAGTGGEFPVVIEPDQDHGLVARFGPSRVLPIHPRHRLGAREGDQALAMYDGQDHAMLTKVLRRAGRETCGTLIFVHNRPKFIPDNRKEGQLLVVNPVQELRERFRVGDRVIGEVVREGNDFAIRLDRALDESSPEVADFTQVCLAYSLPGAFPPEVEAEAAAQPPAFDPAGRADLREDFIFTIDPETAKDFDDAISIEPLDSGGYRLGVHIADVSHFVRQDNPLDVEALERGTSIYLQNRVIPMLPEVLSNGLCSLRPDEDRYALSVFIELDRRLRVREVRPTESLIRSKHRLSYEQALAMIEDRAAGAVDPQLQQTVKDCSALAQRLRAQRERDGALNLYSVEHGFTLDPEGAPIEVTREAGDVAHQLIEEFMLLANRCVARWLHDRGRCAIYRVHGEPDEEKLEFFSASLASYGIKDVDVFSRFGLQAALRRLAEEPEAARLVLNFLCLRCFQKAVYSVENIGHHALAFPYYLHFTSPIRRYPDLQVHRLVKRELGVAGYERSEDRYAYLDALARQCSYLEQRAVAAERDLHKIKAARYLHERIGDVFAGVVTGAARHGLYVQLLETGFDGLIPMRALSDDFYQYDPDRMALVGRSTGRVLGIGHLCDVQVVAVDVGRAEVDLAFA
ncbi:MAG: ribonuclease R family protein [Planctomycetota bacterium]